MFRTGISGAECGAWSEIDAREANERIDEGRDGRNGVENLVLDLTSTAGSELESQCKIFLGIF